MAHKLRTSGRGPETWDASQSMTTFALEEGNTYLTETRGQVSMVISRLNSTRLGSEFCGCGRRRVQGGIEKTKFEFYKSAIKI